MVTSFGNISQLPRHINNLGLFLPGAPHIEQEQAGADGDGAIGDVERRKIIGAPMYFDEIGHGFVYKAIVKIAKGAAQDQCQAGT